MIAVIKMVFCRASGYSLDVELPIARAINFCRADCYPIVTNFDLHSDIVTRLHTRCMTNQSRRIIIGCFTIGTALRPALLIDIINKAVNHNLIVATDWRSLVDNNVLRRTVFDIARIVDNTPVNFVDAFSKMNVRMVIIPVTVSLVIGGIIPFAVNIDLNLVAGRQFFTNTEFENKTVIAGLEIAIAQTAIFRNRNQARRLGRCICLHRQIIFGIGCAVDTKLVGCLELEMMGTRGKLVNRAYPLMIITNSGRADLDQFAINLVINGYCIAGIALAIKCRLGIIGFITRNKIIGVEWYVILNTRNVRCFRWRIINIKGKIGMGIVAVLSCHNSGINMVPICLFRKFERPIAMPVGRNRANDLVTFFDGDNSVGTG